MRLWLDDFRTPPTNEWRWVETADHAIEFFKTHGDAVEFASLDHDLGDYGYYFNTYDDYMKHGGSFRDGIEVVKWMVIEDYWPPMLALHTDNPVGRKNMERLIEDHGDYVTRDWIVHEGRYSALLFTKDERGIAIEDGRDHASEERERQGRT